MGHIATIATCQLNQWALDFEGNCQRIIESIRQAKDKGATLRVGPELEVTGYGCLDHFLESDTFLHSYEMIAKIISHKDTQDILLDIGAPVTHKNVRFNARWIAYNGKILLIRPKLWLANDGNYREMRYFTPWPERLVEDYYLPGILASITGTRKCRIGDAIISTLDTAVAPETCEELFTPRGSHILAGLDGVEIFTNSSGSHHSLRKLNTRLELILEATKKAGGIYIYANQRGCDGDRLYYDGSALITVNGEIKAQGQQFSLDDVEVCCATVDLEEVRSFRCAPSRGMQAVQSPAYERIEVDLRLSKTSLDPFLQPSPTLAPRYHAAEEEIAYAGGCYLYDFLRRVGTAGFMLPLSGGIDSCATAVLVFSMCRLAVQAIGGGNETVLADVRRMCREPDGSNWTPETPQELCSRIFSTAFMGSTNSSKETRERAKALAKDIGAYHIDLNIDGAVTALVNIFTAVTNFQPRFKVYGGSLSENLALQNIQARLRMVITYLFAQLIPTVRGGSGSLLVLGSANVDECLRGYLTKYDCSSADINPIGGISKTDLKRFIGWACENFGLEILQSFLDATPTAELEPITASYVQSDEIDMKMTYKELSVYGTLRKVHRMGPWSMWGHLLHAWGPGSDRNLHPRDVYQKVRDFFWYFNVNRHKMTTMTPSLHMESYSPDDNRFDLRPFVYPVFSWPFKKIEEALKLYESKDEGKGQKLD